jgi:hypothetical protein
MTRYLTSQLANFQIYLAQYFSGTIHNFNQGILTKKEKNCTGDLLFSKGKDGVTTLSIVTLSITALSIMAVLLS